MKLKQLLLKDRPIEIIEVKTNDPLYPDRDMSFGQCSWVNNELVSLDEVNDYSMDEEIYKYHYWLDKEQKSHLIIWVPSTLIVEI